MNDEQKWFIRFGKFGGTCADFRKESNNFIHITRELQSTVPNEELIKNKTFYEFLNVTKYYAKNVLALIEELEEGKSEETK
jgi:hypothetical protein